MPPRNNRNSIAATVLLASSLVYCTGASVLLAGGAWTLSTPAYAADAKVQVAEASATTSDATTKQTELPEGDLTVEDVTVEGNRLVPSEDILNVVKTRRGDKFDREQVMRDLKAVNGMGYFDDRSLQAIPEMGGNGVLLKIRVQENAPVTQFAFQGNSVISNEDLSRLFADQLGKPQNLTQLSQSIDKVEQAYHDKGYMLARVVDVKDDPDGSVGIKVDEGQISAIKITGNKKTKDFIIRHAIKLKPGEVYNERQLTADLRKLYGNGYFQDIRRSLSPDPNNPDKYTLKVEVDEKRTGSVGLGGGIDTANGPFGSFSFGDNNFLGRGQSLQFSSQIGSGMFNGVTNSVNNGATMFLPTGMKTYNISADWIEPSLRGTNTSMGVSAFGRMFGSTMVSDAGQRTIGSSMTFAKPLGRNVTGSLSFSGEQTMLKDFAGSSLDPANTVMTSLAQRAMQLGHAYDQSSAYNYARAIRHQQLRGGLYLTVAPTLERDTRDSRFDPHHGSDIRVTGGPSLGLTGRSFVKLGASFSKYYQVTKETTLAFNVQGGDGIGAVPAFGQYRLGGFNGLRGYRMFSDLGTGSGMLMSSIELRHKLPLPHGDKNSMGGHLVSFFDKNVRAVAFTDVGAVSGNSLINSMYSQSQMGASIGVGLRINMPMIGIVRLDYGFPLLSTATGHFIPRFTFGFGNKF